MKVIVDNKHIDVSKKRGVALGNFDGVHIGHQRLLEVLVKECHDRQMAASVYTFMSHTLSLIGGLKIPPLITSNEIKAKIFEGFGVDALILAEFDKELMSLSPEAFVKNILIDTLNCGLAVVGFDYRFGYKAQGNVALLKELGKKYGFEVFEIDAISIDGEKVSSTSVRKYIEEGNVEKAGEFLGRHFSLIGPVVHGFSRGKKLGFPTANIAFEESNLVPKAGVYATLVMIEDRIYMGATFVGTNPTFQGEKTSVETFIIDFDDSLYDKHIEVRFVKRIREQIKFSSPEALIQQMKLDVEKTKMHLQEIVNVLK